MFSFPFLRFLCRSILALWCETSKSASIRQMVCDCCSECSVFHLLFFFASYIQSISVLNWSLIEFEALSVKNKKLWSLCILTARMILNSKYRSEEKKSTKFNYNGKPKDKKVQFWLKLSFFLHLNYIVYNTIYKLYKKSDNLVIPSPQRLARWKHKLNPLSQEILQKLFFLSIIAKRLKRRPNRFSNLLQALSLSTSLV